jgi:hypothetical protein
VILHRSSNIIAQPLNLAAMQLELRRALHLTTANTVAISGMDAPNDASTITMDTMSATTPTGRTTMAGMMIVGGILHQHLRRCSCDHLPTLRLLSPLANLPPLLPLWIHSPYLLSSPLLSTPHPFLSSESLPTCIEVRIFICIKPTMIH